MRLNLIDLNGRTIISREINELDQISGLFDLFYSVYGYAPKYTIDYAKTA